MNYRIGSLFVRNEIQKRNYQYQHLNVLQFCHTDYLQFDLLAYHRRLGGIQNSNGL